MQIIWKRLFSKIKMSIKGDVKRAQLGVYSRLISPAGVATQ